MKTRRAKVKCTYDNVDISRDIAAFLKSFSVREVLGGEADSAEITLEDREDSQKKLNAITSLPEGMKVAAFIGEEKDFNGADIDNGYFCYPIMYQGEKQVVFCRARRDVNSNKIYVHEVWTEDEIKGIPLQTAAKFSNSKPHGGNTLYTSILADFLNKDNDCSKIVDGNGELLVVYHATREVFGSGSGTTRNSIRVYHVTREVLDTFKPSKSGWYGSGIYLTSDPNDTSYLMTESGWHLMPLMRRRGMRSLTTMMRRIRKSGKPKRTENYST